MTTFNPTPYKTVIEGSNNGDCFELDIFHRSNDWQINWLDWPKDYPDGHEARLLYDEQIYEAYKTTLK